MSPLCIRTRITSVCFVLTRGGLAASGWCWPESPDFTQRKSEALIAELNLGDSVRLTGWIPREELYGLYAHAAACVIPSTFEGFGMPVLEALAAGIPTACSDIPPLRESAGDAALFFDPLDENAIAAALDRITEDELLRRTLAQSGPQQARMFTWERTARKTLEILLSIQLD